MKERITTHKVCEQTFQLLPQKALFWEEKSILIIADLHLGKAGHFRKAGIPISDLVHAKDMLNLEKLIHMTRPQHVIFLGDLFHSEYNQSWPNFKRWILDKEPLTFTLVLGNHDVLPSHEYRINNFDIVDQLDLPPFSFTHMPETTAHYNLAGHIHPAVTLQGKGRQRLKRPCFIFSEEQALLPAFGEFTGTARPQVKKTDAVFAISDDAVIRVN